MKILTLFSVSYSLAQQWAMVYLDYYNVELLCIVTKDIIFLP